MEKFFKVFKAGKYPQGEITAADVDEIAASYNPEFHEAPLTILHDDSSPAYAAVDKVQSEKGNLFVSFKDILPEAFDMNKKFKKPSVELAEYDGKKYLRAVTLTNFPQVKGLDKIQFSESDSLFFNEDLTVNLSKGTNMFSPQIMKLAESLSINISDYSVDTDIIARASEIVIGLNTELAASRDKINSLTISLGKFEEAGLSLEKFEEAKKKIDDLNKSQIQNLITYAIKEKNVLPAQEASLRKLAETNFGEAKIFVEGLPQKVAITNKRRPDSEKPISYEDILKDPSLAKDFSEEQLAEMRKTSKIF